VKTVGRIIHGGAAFDPVAGFSHASDQ